MQASNINDHGIDYDRTLYFKALQNTDYDDDKIIIVEMISNK